MMAVFIPLKFSFSKFKHRGEIACHDFLLIGKKGSVMISNLCSVVLARSKEYCSVFHGKIRVRITSMLHIVLQKI